MARYLVRLAILLATLPWLLAGPTRADSTPDQFARADQEVERLAQELGLPFVPRLVDQPEDTSHGKTYMDFSGNRHVEVSPSLVDQPHALRLTIVHELQHFEDLKILDADGLLIPQRERDRRSHRHALKDHMEVRAYTRQLAALDELWLPGRFTPAEEANFDRLRDRYEERLSASTFMRDTVANPGRHAFTLDRRLIELEPGESAAVIFQRDYIYPEDLPYRIDVEDADQILVDPPKRGRFAGIRGRSVFRISTHPGSRFGAIARLTVEAETRQLPNARRRDTVEIRVRAPLALRFATDRLRLKHGESRTVALARHPGEQPELAFEVGPRDAASRDVASVVAPHGVFPRSSAEASVTVRAGRSGTTTLVARATHPAGFVARAELEVVVDDVGEPGGPEDPGAKRPGLAERFDAIPASLGASSSPVGAAPAPPSLGAAAREVAVGYVGEYLKQAYALGDATPAIRQLPAPPPDTHALPAPSDVLRKVAGSRDAGFTQAESRIELHLDRVRLEPVPERRSYRFEVSAGSEDAGGRAGASGLKALVDAHQIKEEAFVERAYAAHVAGLPSDRRQRLIEAHAFHQRFGDATGAMFEAAGTARDLGSLARIYYTSGFRGLMQNLARRGCHAFLGKVNALIQGAAFEAGAGPLGSYLVGHVAERFQGVICNVFLPALFEEGTGESWLTGDVVYAADRTINEWVKILYTGEIVGGPDRPELPSGIDFYSAHGVRDRRQLLARFRDQAALHAALKAHLLGLWDRHAALRPWLDITQEGRAWTLWTRIYRVASEAMARALQEELDDRPAEPARAPELERYGESWLTGAQQRRIAPTLVLEEPDRLDEVEAGQEVSVLTRFALLGFAGQDEAVKVRWDVRGGTNETPLTRDELFRFAFPHDRIDPAGDLTKTGVGTFVFKADADRFPPGGTYRVHVSFGDLDRQLVLPFTVKGPRSGSPPAGASPGQPADGRGPGHVFFVIRVEGRGFVPHWAGASFVVAGANEEVFRLERGQDLTTALKAYHARLVGDLCAVRIPGMPGACKRPMIWNAGPRISVVDGPIREERELRSIKLADTWKRVKDDGPDLNALKKRGGCR